MAEQFVALLLEDRKTLGAAGYPWSCCPYQAKRMLNYSLPVKLMKRSNGKRISSFFLSQAEAWRGILKHCCFVFLFRIASNFTTTNTEAISYMLGCFSVSVIHHTQTRATGSLTHVHDPSSCICTWRGRGNDLVYTIVSSKGLFFRPFYAWCTGVVKFLHFLLWRLCAGSGCRQARSQLVRGRWQPCRWSTR